MKTEVYSWRVSTQLKTGLEREARHRKLSLSAVLDIAASEWLNKNRESLAGDVEQQRLHRAASKYIGAIEGSQASRSTEVGRLVRQRLRERYGR